MFKYCILLLLLINALEASFKHLNIPSLRNHRKEMKSKNIFETDTSDVFTESGMHDSSVTSIENVLSKLNNLKNKKLNNFQTNLRPKTNLRPSYTIGNKIKNSQKKSNNYKLIDMDTSAENYQPFPSHIKGFSYDHSSDTALYKKDECLPERLFHICGPNQEYRKCDVAIDGFCHDQKRRCYCQTGYSQHMNSRGCVIDDDDNEE